MVVGIDEAGRGPLAGAVVGCALYLKELPPFVPRDSKEISSHRRVEMFSWLVENSIFSLGIASPAEIDKLNILQATFLAFERAIEGIIKKFPDLEKAEFIIDGNMFHTKREIKYRCIPKADQLVKEVSCASILAKVTRDYFMQIADFIYPQWKFSQHKGYPTKEHIDCIREHQLSPLHRRSFSPCRGDS